VSLLHVIASFQSGVFQVYRAAGGTYTAGRYVAAAAATFTVAASVQPLGKAQLQLLPEGQRASDARMLWTATELFTRDANQAPDVVVIEGERFYVLNVSEFFRNYESPSHYAVVLAREAVA
jgi:hypothetical protein